jgi:hypothetical protein
MFEIALSSALHIRSKNDLCTNSRPSALGERHRQSAPQAGHASYLKRTVTPEGRNSKVRTREYLTEADVERLMAAQGQPLGPEGRIAAAGST